MAYYRFTRNDLFVNTLTLYPDVSFVVYNGASYYNNTPQFTGEFTSSIRLTTPGNISLYELNVDRTASDTGRIIGDANIPDTGLVYPWIAKDGSRMNFRTSTSEQFAGTAVGHPIKGVYPLTATIGRTFYDTTTARYVQTQFSRSNAGEIIITTTGSVSNLHALKNTINYYEYMSPQFQYSSSNDASTAGICSRALAIFK